MTSTPPRRPRILIVYPYLPHYRAGIFSALDALPEVTVAFAASDRGRDGIEVMDARALREVHPLQNVFVKGVLWQRGLLRLTASRSFDVVVFLGSAGYASTWLAAVVARITRKKVVFWTIGWHRPDRGIRRVVRLSFYRLAHQLWLYADRGAVLGRSMGYPGTKMVVVGNSAHSSTVPSPSSEGTIPPSDLPTIVAVARLTPAKRLHLLVLAAERLAAEGRPVRLLLAGDGPERAALADLCAEHGVTGDFVGAVYSPRALAAVYAQASVACVPSAAGLSVIQSLEAGVPVVTDDHEDSQMPEAEAVHHRVTGSRYRHDDVDDLAAELSFWIDASADRADEVARACRDEVQRRWTPSAQVALMRRALNVLLPGRLVAGDR